VNSRTDLLSRIR